MTRLAFLFLLVLAHPSYAQGRSTILPGETRAIAPGAAVSTYSVVGGAGTVLDVTARGKGPMLVTLYTPAGEPMLSAEGDSAVTLAAILPLDDVFFVSVARADSTARHTVQVTATEDDAYFADFAEYVGYELLDATGKPFMTQCWVEPGVELRVRYLDPRSTVASYDAVAGRGGRSFVRYTMRNGTVMDARRTLRFEADERVLTTQFGTNAPTVSRSPWPPAPAATGRVGRYAGYRC